MKVPRIFFSILASFAFLNFCYGESEEAPLYSLPPIEIEAETKPDESEGPTTMRTFSLPTGKGSYDPIPQLNAVGIDLILMERDPDFTQWRRGQEWLIPISKSEKSVQALHLNFLRDLGLWALFQGQKEQTQWQWKIEMAAKKRQQKIHYWENNNTPYTSSDDTLKGFVPHNQETFLSFQGKQKNIFLSLEHDDQKTDVLLLKRSKGQRKKGQWDLSLQWMKLPWELTAFNFQRIDQFYSTTSLLTSNKTKNKKLGFSAARTFTWNQDFSIHLLYSQETLRRTFTENHPSQSFLRNQGDLKFTWKNLSAQWIEWVEVDTYAFLSTAEDQAKSKKNWRTGNFGLSLSSSHQYPVGVSFKSKRYQNIPRPLDVFGDGGALSSSPQLPLEIGTKFSTGPWVKWKGVMVASQAFSEEVTNLPLQMKISPAEVRTFAIGGVWVRGLETEFHFEPAILDNLSLSFKHSYQQALNNGKIPSLKGKSIPGRPPHTLETSLILSGLSGHNTQFGLTYQWADRDFIDLANTWQIPQQRVWDLFLQYKNPKQSWALRLDTHNLFPQQNDSSQLYSFQGRVAPNLLRPDRSEREFLLTAEILL